MYYLAKQKLLPFSTLLALGFIWGTGYSIARFAMTSGVPPFAYSFWQSLGPAIILSSIVFCQHHKFMRNSSAIRYYVICGLTGIAIPNTLMYFAALHLPANILAMVVNIVPILAYPMALYARLETFSINRCLGIIIAVIGLMFIILPKSSLPASGMVPWVLLTMCTPFSFAFCSIFIARYRPNQASALTLSAGMLIASSILLIPMLFVTNSFYFFHWPLSLADKVILLEIILSSIGYILFFYLIKIAGPVYYSLVDTIVVLTGIFWGYMIFAEQLNQWTAAAVGLIVLALLLVTKQNG